MPWAIPQLDILVAALLALGLCILVVAVVSAFFGVVGGVLGKLPVIGGWIDASAHHISQRITNVMGKAIAKLEIIVGASWHATARLVDKIGEEIAAHAGLLATIAGFLPGVGVLANLYGLVNSARLLVAKLAHEIVGIGHDVGVGTKALTRTINHVVLPRLGRLEREYDHIVNKDIAGLRSRAKAVEGDLSKVWDYIRSHPWTVVTDAFVGAVAVALTRLGLNWIRCPAASKFFNKRGCNAWNDIDALLALTVAAVAVEDFRALVKLLQGIEHAAVEGIETVLSA